MKNSWQILTLLLAIALCLMALRDTLKTPQGDEAALEPQAAEELILNNIMTRNSVRAYTDKPVSDELIETLLRAGMAAPTAGNKQPWAFVVVTDKDVLTQIGVHQPNAKMAGGAPLAIVVCGDPSKGFEGKGSEYWIQDCSAVSENILLAAHALGLGAVWTGVYPMDERVAKISALLGLPQGIIPLNVIPIGYPSGETPVKDKWNPELIKYNHW